MRQAIRIGVVATCLAVAWPVSAGAAGFALTDLTRVKPAVLKISGKTFVSRAAPDRLTFGCKDCAGLEAVDVLLDKSTDGTEQRFRSGATTIARIQEICRTSEPTCAIERIEMNGAVGWVSRTKAVGSFISTTILFKNGGQLVIRPIAETLKAAFDNGLAVRLKLAPQIIG